MTMTSPGARAARSGGAGGGEVGWIPPEDVLRHDGERVDLSRRFFQPPPAEIGKLYTAHSTLKLGGEPFSLGMRLMITLFVPALMLALGLLLARNDTTDTATVPVVIGAFAAILAFAIGWYFTGFWQSCSYVGEAGVVRYIITGAPGVARAKAELFLFDTAAELRTSQTRNFYNGIYTGTTYRFNWTDAVGAKRFLLSGQYHSKQGTPKPDDKFWYASSAERAWNIRQLARIQRELEANGFVQFNLGGSDFVRVGPGFFEFGMKGEVARINAEEIKTLNLNQGQFVIHHKDAGWFSRKGKFSFSYGKMANAQLFLLAMEKLSGFRFKN
jgi:hypothetical protein